MSRKIEYAAWLKKHPSALSMFEDLMVEAKAKQVVVFLDYDGTLSPIVEDPDRAYVSDDVCQHLHAFPDKASFSDMPCTLLGSDTSLKSYFCHNYCMLVDEGSVSDDYIYFMLC
ncbi:unnamed protein product [Sphagnum troendelagicum]|uniref:Trehalose-6-phosphate phosphatase n=1 Tax=Sphagnum troendelagicum TaxID=128251 RepID=A0ABP0TJ76_9BRYO